MSVTKTDIINSVYREVGLSKPESAKIVDLVFETIKETLAKGESITISGLGTFSLIDKSSRMGRNPQTGDAMEITERRVLMFKVSTILKEDITNRYAHRIDENGNENEAIPVEPGVLRAASWFTQNEDDDE